MNRTPAMVGRFRLFALSIVAFGLLPVGAKAVPVCQTASLADYIALNQQGGCTVGPLTFFRFAAPTPTSTGNPALADASKITMNPISSREGTGFLITAVQNGYNYFSLPNPTTAQSASYFINYTVDPPPIEVGEILGLDPPFGNVTASNNSCLFDVISNGCQFGIPVRLSVSTESPFSSVVFPTPSFFTDVQLTVNMQASPGNPAGFDGLVSIFQLTDDTAAVPEPMSMLLTGIGFAGLFGVTSARRRAKSK